MFGIKEKQNENFFEHNILKPTLFQYFLVLSLCANNYIVVMVTGSQEAGPGEGTG